MESFFCHCFFITRNLEGLFFSFGFTSVNPCLVKHFQVYEKCEIVINDVCLLLCMYISLIFKHRINLSMKYFQLNLYFKGGDEIIYLYQMHM